MIKFKSIFLLIFIGSINAIGCNNTYSTETFNHNITAAQVLKEIFRRYDKNELPPTENNQPNTVSFHLYIKSIYDISEQTSSFTIRYYINLLWNDPRLKFTPFMQNNTSVDLLKLPIESVKEKGKFLLCITISTWITACLIRGSYFHLL